MLAAIALATFVAFLVPGASGAAAASAQSPSRVAFDGSLSCTTGFICVWSGPGFTGDIAVINPGSTGTCYVHPGVFNSVWNATDDFVAIWASRWCWGPVDYISPGTGRDTRFPGASIS
jgi:hypothetical protein